MNLVLKTAKKKLPLHEFLFVKATAPSKVSLEDEELNRELNELDSFGKTEAGEYHQASFFDPEYGLSSADKPLPVVEKKGSITYEYRGEKYTYLAPKKEPDVPHEFIKQVVLRGTGFAGGRSRVCEIFHTEVDAGTRAKRIKQEYGQGGAGWPLEGYGLHGYDTFHGQGIRFQHHPCRLYSRHFVTQGTGGKIGIFPIAV